MDDPIADLTGVMEATPSQFSDQMSSLVDIQHFGTRSLRRRRRMGRQDPDEFDPTFEEEASFGRAGPSFTSRARLKGRDRGQAEPSAVPV